MVEGQIINSAYYIETINPNKLEMNKRYPGSMASYS